MSKTMDRLEIDEGMRGLIKQLWKHKYGTTNSCEGHGLNGYVMFSGGDGWFEKRADQYGLYKSVNNLCCETKPEDERCRGNCGSGINGNSIYRGTLIPGPFNPKV